VLHSFTFESTRRMSTDYGLAFLTGLVGSMHCVGMCGAIVLAYSTQGIKGNGRPPHRLLSHFSYNAGRVLSYALAGAVLGFLGHGLAAIQGVGYWFSLISGILLIILGLLLTRVVPGFAFLTELSLTQKTSNLFFKMYRASFGVLVTSPGLEAKFYIGFLTPLLPCGLLYSMFVKAASTGSGIAGAMTMLSFGLGIVPALVIVGMASSFFTERLRVWGDKIAAAAVILMGVMLVLRALAAEGHVH
jgi:sulfite exporter TauE/SafE